MNLNILLLDQWNLFSELATVESRWEILDWYRLKENLYKVGGSLKRLAAAEALLWQGQVEAAKALFAECRRKQARNELVAVGVPKQDTVIGFHDPKARKLAEFASG